MALPPPQTLSEKEWLPLRGAHRARVDAWTTDRLARRRAGLRHPVDDFLFDYYANRPGQLRQWHPGFGIALAGPRSAEYLQHSHYVESDERVTVSSELLRTRSDRISWVTELLRRTQVRAPSFGCFGLHEWAMVYRLGDGEVRHADWPLRLGPQRVAEVVDEQGLRCTHFDAFRFFTADAEPRNASRPTRAGQLEQEQPGCLHAGMDLYKWAFQLSPLVGSDLVADCFELARDARAVDMRAAPYDLRALGYEPIRVEEPEGRAEFVRAQRDLMHRAQRVRSNLLGVLTELKAQADDLVPDRVAG